MVKKLSIIQNDDGSYIYKDSTSLETSLILNVLTDTCKNELRTQDWIYDSYYEVYEGNCSLLTKENDTMIFQSLFDDKNPPNQFKCSRDAFITLIDQWNSARKENKEFIIIELDENNTINLYASDTVPANYTPNSHQQNISLPDSPLPSENFFYNQAKEDSISINGVHHDYLENTAHKIKYQEENSFIILSRKNGRKGIYKLLFKGYNRKTPRAFFPSTWTHEQVFEKIYEAIRYAKKNNIPFKSDKNYFNIRSLTKENIEIMIVLNKKGCIITAYPII